MTLPAETPRRAALITGASRGIGASIAERLAAAGWDLTLSARTSTTLAQTAARLAQPAQGTVLQVPSDMAVPGNVSALAAAHAQRFDRLDALILNAGMGSIGPFAEFPLRRLDKLLAVNVRAAYQLVQESLPLLRRTAAASPLGARVIALSSMTGIAAEPQNSAYGATKAALTSLCETLTSEESAHGLSGTAVCPGYVATDMTAGLHGQVPAADMIPAADVAEIVVAVTRLSKTAVVPVVPIARPGAHIWRA